MLPWQRVETSAFLPEQVHTGLTTQVTSLWEKATLKDIWIPAEGRSYRGKTREISNSQLSGLCRWTKSSVHHFDMKHRRARCRECSVWNLRLWCTYHPSRFIKNLKKKKKAVKKAAGYRCTGLGPLGGACAENRHMTGAFKNYCELEEPFSLRFYHRNFIFSLPTPQIRSTYPYIYFLNIRIKN